MALGINGGVQEKMSGKPSYPMPTEKRAKQFMPFAALTGFAEALEAKEHVTVPRRILSEEMAEELDRKMHRLIIGELVTVVYYSKQEYVKVTGVLARIDIDSRVLQIVQTRIPFDDILDVCKD